MLCLGSPLGFKSPLDSQSLSNFFFCHKPQGESALRVRNWKKKPDWFELCDLLQQRNGKLGGTANPLEPTMRFQWFGSIRISFVFSGLWLSRNMPPIEDSGRSRKVSILGLKKSDVQSQLALLVGE